jgi:hypothetical protein
MKKQTPPTKVDQLLDEDARVLLFLFGMDATGW